MCWQSQSCHEQVAGIVLPADVPTMYVDTCRRNDGVFDLCRNINERLFKSANMYLWSNPRGQNVLRVWAETFLPDALSYPRGSLRFGA